MGRVHHEIARPSSRGCRGPRWCVEGHLVDHRIWTALTVDQIASLQNRTLFGWSGDEDNPLHCSGEKRVSRMFKHKTTASWDVRCILVGAYENGNSLAIPR